jgi:hypothetical protein
MLFMNKIILHRGNTLNSQENTRNSISSDGLFEDKFVKDYVENIGKIPEVILEVDVILSDPFIVMHDSEGIAGDYFLHSEGSSHLNGLKNFEIKRSDIPNIIYKESLSQPLILQELLDIAKQKNIKLYIDVKVPSYNIYFNVPMKYKIINDNINNVFCMMENYIDNIDCVLSFDPIASHIIYNKININNINIGFGIFKYDFFGYDLLNEIYFSILVYKYQPDIISLSKEMLSTWKNNYMQVKNIYIWSIHKNDLIKYCDIIKQFNCSPVIDMYDL